MSFIRPGRGTLPSTTQGSQGIDRLNVSWETATPEQIGIYAPTTTTVSDGSVTVRYKESSSGTWLTAHPLLRISTTGNEAGGPTSIVDAFAGSIFDLTPNTTYDVELTHIESGQQTKVSSYQRTTRALPSSSGATTVSATTADNLQTKFDSLSAGDVLQLSNGTYTVSGLTLSNSGTSGSPIYIRGASRSGVIIKDTTGIVIAWNASHVVMETLTIEGSSVDAGIEDGTPPHSKAIYITGNRTNITVRNCAFVGVDQGITSNDAQTGLLFYNNTITGNNLWSYVDDSSSDPHCTWDDDACRVPGFGNCAWSNTITGFGDAFSVMAGERAEGVYFYRNRVAFTGDDSFEADYGTRNLGYYDNYITNCGTALSLDPLYGGPLYYFRNVVINIARAPLKWNANNTGMLVYNNTFCRTNATNAFFTDWGQIQYNNGALNNWSFRNNLFVYRGTTAEALWQIESTGNTLLDIDYNGWYSDAAVKWSPTGANYSTVTLAIAGSGQTATTALFGTSTRRHEHDKVVASNPWTSTVTLGANHLTQYTDYPDVSLIAGAAKNAGTSISNITTGFSGAAPDMGAIIAGRSVVTYGDSPAWMNGLATLTWTSLSNTSPSSVGADTGVCAYSGAALKAANSQLIVFGGGHGDSSTNAVYGITLSVDSPVCVVLDAGSSPNTATNVEYQADGKPSSRHTWGDLQVDDSNNRMVTFECINPYGDSGIYKNARDGFDLTTNTWYAAGTYSNAPFADGYATIANSSTKDSAGNMYWWEENGSALYKMTPGTTSTPASTAASMPASTYNVCIACDTSRNRLVTFNAADSFRYDLNNNYARTSVTFSGAQSAQAAQGSYWTYCPDRDSFIGAAYTGGSATMYECDASTFSVTTLSLSGTAPTLDSDGRNNFYGRLVYAPRLRGVVFLPKADANVFFFRTG